MAVKTEWLNVTGPGGAFKAYLATPGKPAPGVLVVQEIFGINVHIRDVTARLAEAGYCALAPDIFWRLVPGIELGYVPDDIEQGRNLKTKTSVDDVITDVRACFETLAARSDCSGKLGIVGFCYGGLITYLAAARLNPACAASYYGGGIADYLGEADAIDCPIQFHFGDQDAAIPMSQVDQVRAALSDQAAEVFVYPGAGHGFHCDQRGSYDAASAATAWQRTLDLFNQHLR